VFELLQVAGVEPPPFLALPPSNTCPVLPQRVSSANPLEGTLHTVCIQLETKMIKSAGSVPKMISNSKQPITYLTQLSTFPVIERTSLLWLYTTGRGPWIFNLAVIFWQFIETLHIIYLLTYFCVVHPRDDNRGATFILSRMSQSFQCHWQLGLFRVLE